MADLSSPQVVFESPLGLLGIQTDKLRYVPEETVHIWAFDLRCDNSLTCTFFKLLSDDEIARSQRFKSELNRTDFIVAHGLLRMVLAQYCGIRAHQLRFLSSNAGKPSIIPAEGAASSPFFNLSHCSGRMLLAIAANSDIGVDLENEQDGSHVGEIAARFFVAAEFVAIMACPESERVATFFRYWVAKEAVLKATGAGLGIPLDQFTVNWCPHGDLAHTTSIDQPQFDGKWKVQMLNCGPRWHAAVSARNSLWVPVFICSYQ